ncbi:MAG: hypothetical protein ABI811_18815 [Acidobacteriota bacterium]
MLVVFVSSRREEGSRESVAASAKWSRESSRKSGLHFSRFQGHEINGYDRSAEAIYHDFAHRQFAPAN